MDVALDKFMMAGVLAGGDSNPVAALSHPRLHAWEGTGRSCTKEDVGVIGPCSPGIMLSSLIGVAIGDAYARFNNVQSRYAQRR